MNEQVKELIRSVVKPNGAGLINGQNLQDVLVEMVDNTVPASSSYATEAGKVTFKLRISGSGVDAEYDGSQDVTASLENYPDREEVTGEINEATESVKDWVIDQHYLTSASLSGSVTEEVVDRKISDATASVKEWVGEQGYATTASVLEVSESVNELSSSVSTTLGNYATTQSVNQLSQSVAEDFANLDIPDISGLATTASVNELSSSVAQDFANLDIPDISGLATTASVNELSSSVGAALDTLATTQSLNELSESVSASIAGIEIPDISGLATTSSVLQVSESVSELSASVASDFENLDIPDISGLATTASVNELSASVAESIENIDLSEYATTASVEESINESTQSVKTWVTSQHYLTSASLSGSVTEEVVEMKINDATASVQQWVEDQHYLTEHQDISYLATTASVNQLSASVAESIDNIVIPDVSGFATTSSVTASINEATASVKTWVEDKHYLTEHQSLAGLFDSASYSSTTKKIYFYDKGENQVGEIDATAFIKDGMVDGVTIDTGSNQLVITFNTDAGKEDITLDLNQIFNPNNYYVKSEVDTIATASVSQSQAWVEEQGYLTEHQDISYLATTASVSGVSESVFNLSSSVASDFENLDIPDVSGLATTASVTELSASVAEDLKNVEVDLSEYATTASVNQLSSSVATDFENLNLSGFATTASVTELSESVANNFIKYATTQSVNNLSSSIAQDLNSLTQDLDTLATTASVLQVSESVWSLSSSVALDFKNLDLDFSSYATTASVNEVSRSVNSLSSSVAEDFANIDIPDVSTLATTASVNNLSSSVAEDFANLNIPDVSGLATTASVTQLSQSVAESIENIDVDLSEYATTASVNQLSSSVATDFENLNIPDVSTLATTASVNELSQSVYTDSASFNNRINNITGSGGDNLRDFLFGVETQVVTGITGSVVNINSTISSNSVLGFNAIPDNGTTLDIVVKNTGLSVVTLDIPSSVEENNTTYNTVINGVSGSSYYLPVGAGEYGEIIVTRQGSLLYVRTSIDLSVYALETSVNSLSASFDTRINEISSSGGGDNLRDFLFGVETQTITNITGSVTNIVSSVSANATLGFTAVPDEGKSLGIVIQNTGNDAVTVSLPDTVVVGGTTYTLVNNGVVNSGSVDIAAGEYGDVVVTRIGSNLYLRTSVDLSNVQVDLSGYATTASVNALSASFDTRINEISGSGGGGGSYLPIAGGTITGNLKVNGKMAVGAASLSSTGNSCLSVGHSATRAGGNYSLAVGENCQTNVYGGFVAGRESVVEGNGAFGAATGFRCRAIAMAAYAGGCRSTGSANFATAIGFGAEAKALGQVVLGSYNAYDPEGGRESTGSYAVIFGIGKSSTWNQDNPGTITRENGLAIKWNGDIDIQYSGSVVALQAKIAELEARLAALES